MQDSRASSPRDEAARVRGLAGARPAGQRAAEARRPLVAHASYVPSDVEPPRYSLPSSDYMQRFQQARQVDAEKAAERRVEIREESPRRDRSERPPKKTKSSTRLCIAMGILLGLAVLALMAMASLAVYECSGRDGPFTHKSGTPGLEAPCVELTSNANGQCTAPGTWSAYVNSTGGECCMPVGFVCGIDNKVAEACTRDAVRVRDFIGMGPAERMCCHPAGLGAKAVGLLSLGVDLKSLSNQAQELARLGFSADDLDTMAAQLGALSTALQDALTELPHTLELVKNAKDLADGAITQRAAEEAAAAERAKQAALEAARLEAEAANATKAALRAL